MLSETVRLVKVLLRRFGRRWRLVRASLAHELPRRDAALMGLAGLLQIVGQLLAAESIWLALACCLLGSAIGLVRYRGDADSDA